jgi:hypothetical protein
MTLEGIVQNGIVVLEQGCDVPNGTQVQVIVPEAIEICCVATEETSRREDVVMLEPWVELPRPKPIAVLRAHPGNLPMPDPPIMPAEEEGSAA